MVKNNKTVGEALISIQSILKAPKGQYNKFGNYAYRSAEDILEALKPLLKEHECILTITEDTKDIAGYLVLESTAIISKGNDTISVKGHAGINPERKGMDIAQSFGSSSSYAKKYALGNLFLLDDTKDADSTTNPKEVKPIENKPVMTLEIYHAMLEYINTGKADLVANKLSKYKMTKKQSDTLNKMIKENKK
tara:strand:+ start:9939 stop:10517 length:579 start_codon:yes stop_codon:yes gene_type:complete